MTEDTADLNPTTGRPYSDHGSAEMAIEFVLTDNDGRYQADVFLQAWQHGDLSEWPEYYEWLAKNEAAAPSPQAQPVAWRARSILDPKRPWVSYDAPEDIEALKRQGREMQPLYLHQPTSPPHDQVGRWHVPPEGVGSPKDVGVHHYHDDEWGWTANADDTYHAEEWLSESGEDFIRIQTLIEGPDLYAVRAALTFTEDGDPDETEVRFYGSEADARDALASAPRASQVGEGNG